MQRGLHPRVFPPVLCMRAQLYPKGASYLTRLDDSDTGVIKIYSAGTSNLLGYFGKFGFTPTLTKAWHYTYTVPGPESSEDLVNFPYYVRDCTPIPIHRSANSILTPSRFG